MNISREEAQQILDVLDAAATEFICDFQASEPPSHLRAAITLLQARLAEPDTGANVEFPTPAYLRVSDDPVDISIIDYYTEPQLRAYADARVAAARLAEGEQEPVAWIQADMSPVRHDGSALSNWTSAGWTPLYAAPQGAPK